MCGAACEAVAAHREQAATKQIHLPEGKKGRYKENPFREIKGYESS